MRVLAVGNMYPPHHLGGYELVWRSAMRHLSARGHEVRVLTTDWRGEASAADDPGTFRELRWYWRDHAWPAISWRQRVSLERHNASTLERHLNEFRPQVVSWWSMGGMSLSLIERVRRRRLPAVAFVHDDWLIYGPEVDRWVRPFRRSATLARLAERVSGLPARVELDRAASFVFVSEATRRATRAAGYRLEGSSIAHSGIDAQYLVAAEERDWRWQLLYVGRIDERKGVTDAVGAIAQLPNEATLTLAGSGDRRVLTELRRIARELGVGERIRERGLCTPPQLRELYAESDAVLFPVRWEEPWGLVPLEAMGIGRPVVASGRGGSGEYLRDGRNCLIAAAADPGALAGAVRRLADDPELRSRLRAGGFETAAQHTDVVFNEAVEDALHRATAHPAPNVS